MYHYIHVAIAAAVFAGSANAAASLADVCTPTYVKSHLPATGFYQGITINASTVTASPVYNASIASADFYPAGVISYCNVTFSYTHNGRGDNVHLNYWLPAPADFRNRYLSTGGGGLAINSGITTSGSLPGGLLYGASAGLTDAGFGSFTTQFDAVFLLANGTINYEALYMFGYEAIHEMTVIGKAFTSQFFNMNGTKLYSYYQACSEGGREGWSQVQRFTEFDGAITGAPAFRYGFQQTNHLVENVVEKTLDYYPPSCEFDKIVNETIAFCDPLDGRADGVVARSDLCKLHFNMSSLIGKPYYCAATSASTGGFGGPPGKSKRQFSGASAAVPAQNGTVSAKGVAVVETILAGLKDTRGRQVYLPYQPGSTFVDGVTTYNATSASWGLSISGLGGEWVTRFLQLRNTSTLATLDGVTYDTLRDWMLLGWQRYEDSLQTTWPDLTPYQQSGGKVIHVHGEQDNSVPPASSVRYWDSVRNIMYPGMCYNDSVAAINEWYRLYLVPGAAHCGPNSLQPNGPWPQTTLQTMIEWVEQGKAPQTLNATVLSGANKGQAAQLCTWPLRPLWSNNGTSFACVYDAASLKTWKYTFDSIPLPVY